MTTGTKLIAGAAAIALLVACQARFGKDEGETAVAAKADEGSFSIDLPGFGMKLDMPERWAEQAKIDADNKIFPPGARFRGFSVQAGREGKEDGVELRFTAADAPAKIAQWYRDGAPRDELTIASATEQDGVYTLAGTTRDDDDPFTVRLSAAEGGGTAGRISFTDRN